MPISSSVPAASGLSGGPSDAQLAAIARQFDQLASPFSQAQRLFRIALAPDSGLPDGALLPLRLIGSEGICEPLRYSLKCLSTDVRLPLKTLSGLPIAFHIVDDHNRKHTICAIVTAVDQITSDGGFVLNELTCVDALGVIEERVTWRVFPAASVIDVTDAILGEHVRENHVLASAFELDTSHLRGTYPQRAFTMQAGESDAGFLMRLWRREGIAWYFTHEVKNDHPVHTLRLVDDIHAWRNNPAHSVRFNRADATEPEDTIVAFRAHRRVTPASVQGRSHDYRTGRPQSVSEDSRADQGTRGHALSATLSRYHYDAPHVADSLLHYEQINSRRQQAHALRSKDFSGESVVRAFSGAAGSIFTLNGHPEIDTHAPDQRRFLLTSVEVDVRNNFLPRSPGNRLTADATDEPGYLNRFRCIRADIPFVPDYDPAAVPHPGPMTASVVGAPGAEIDVDEEGRIAVRFHFARQEDHPVKGASGTPRDSARIRYAPPWADQRAGTAFWPRVGNEILILFQHGDPDKPIGIATLHGANTPPPQFSGAGALPGNAALYGIRSKEVKGVGYGELLFDDTTGETKTKLSSEHGKTQLNQGWIGHPRADGRSEKRGEGFELRTDLSGAIRAAQLMISTDSRQNATGKVMDRQELIGQLETALAIARQLASLAETHEADTTDTDGQEKLVEQIRKWEDGAGGGAIALSAPNGIAAATPRNIVASAGRHLDMIAVQDANLSTGRKILLRAAQGLSAFAKAGMKLIAGTGDVVVQAQQGKAEVGSAERLHLYSLKELLIEAPSITFKASGVTYSLADGKVLASSSGPHTIESAGFTHSGGGGGNPDLPHMPASTMQTDEKFAVATRRGDAFSRLGHQVEDETQAVRDTGRLAADGAHETTVQDAQIRPLTFIPKL
ncbi:type VI secretion system Vgr family protein [Burkholderia stagnalis]|uniref:Type VI secretion system tip protein VgrG n=1 Tax=Burkholderia stagnalis TaxID=1503054 RepID=A0A6L3N759_9BURK|nr:type VI secretion system Vgr family protein [Burkholderia stagnalis]KAB0641190.1 type VI secretion system tip protein VgrG [Burkholderia stagnalis]VWB15813.1 phage-like baseplate assembly protein [Burkholderia stagnalis]